MGRGSLGILIIILWLNLPDFTQRKRIHDSMKSLPSADKTVPALWLGNMIYSKAWVLIKLVKQQTWTVMLYFSRDHMTVIRKPKWSIKSFLQFKVPEIMWTMPWHFFLRDWLSEISILSTKCTLLRLLITVSYYNGAWLFKCPSIKCSCKSSQVCISAKTKHMKKINFL